MKPPLQTKFPIQKSSFKISIVNSLAVKNLWSQIIVVSPDITLWRSCQSQIFWQFWCSSKIGFIRIQNNLFLFFPRGVIWLFFTRGGAFEKFIIIFNSKIRSSEDQNWPNVLCVMNCQSSRPFDSITTGWYFYITEANGFFHFESAPRSEQFWWNSPAIEIWPAQNPKNVE